MSAFVRRFGLWWSYAAAHSPNGVGGGGASALLLESSDYLLLETGDRILLE